jgi:hypothetical protein
MIAGGVDDLSADRLDLADQSVRVVRSSAYVIASNVVFDESAICSS